MRSARCILLTPSLHLRSYDDGVNRDGVCDGNDCGLVSDDGAVDGIANVCGADDDDEGDTVELQAVHCLP